MPLRRNSLGAALFLSLAVWLLPASPTGAAVVTADWKDGGDGLLTLDLDNDLEWLDLRQTMSGNFNRTYEDVSSQLGIGGEFEGFRYATESDLLGLWESAGIPNVNSGGTTSNFNPVSDLIVLMDDTSAMATNPFSYGILSESNSPGSHIAAGIDITSPTTGRARTLVVEILDNQTNLSGGHFLVRPSAVPEPSSFAAIAAIASLAAFRRRSRQLR